MHGIRLSMLNQHAIDVQHSLSAAGKDSFKAVAQFFGVGLDSVQVVMSRIHSNDHDHDVTNYRIQQETARLEKLTKEQWTQMERRKPLPESTAQVETTSANMVEEKGLSDDGSGSSVAATTVEASVNVYRESLYRESSVQDHRQ
uniref:Uncharacterized protein n=1 Tax=Haptolina ericina TaxID=156174 RepID=A0A7S3B9C1_9EUKA|mmetsp:Transcript_54457/g.121937  ORF Transcript_54457/g.121937 Transcript_54457/m.121937 type:complete len:144 (+) Transcript_54457:579-1010(+)|eukprot:CAMPEP_0181224910 /NCGR_PEP_ID=MMETSP1096-20121128/31395_1 /TAXON_ID=156174 ORGANISM="Chrysochromulina ericina, Strain CCMP281" /NCGR_SAMPLE_ID=MMETSP1096 /ASSEMBLY_ACC=CAM_ASM_000453 /LENGTH=143 /DNA_ID=CAMNT_0023318057 /DNA_START=768 /DNA_END=1199 /DNA_ORIENTATION=+